MAHTRRTTLVAGAVLAPVFLVLGGIVFTSGDSPDAAPDDSSSVRLVAGASEISGDPDAVVAALQDRLERLPQDDASWAALGFAYVAQARVTADPSLYDRAARALERSLEERPDGNSEALAGQAALANARHEFALGRDLAQQAVQADPYSSTAKGILADSQLELGEYDVAQVTLQEMVDLRPGVPSFTRISYSYELRGDTDNARLLLEQALELSSAPSDASFSLFHLGRIAFDTGDHATAVERYDEGLRRDPSNVQLLAGRAAAHAALGDVEAAVADYETVVQRLPEPLYVVEYAELLDRLGRSEDAAEQYAVADAIRTLFDAAGVVPDVEIALYEADHGDPVRALDVAERNYETRRSVQVEDALAWALHANGRDAEALEHASAAQAIGTRNALWDYHRGMIQLELGMVEEARASLEQALDTNPEFSQLHAPLARQALTETGGT